MSQRELKALTTESREGSPTQEKRLNCGKIRASGDDAMDGEGSRELEELQEQLREAHAKLEEKSQELVEAQQSLSYA